MRIAVKEGRHTRSALHCGVYGEHGGEPESMNFFDEVALDYVRCLPFRVLVARLAVARSVIKRRSAASKTR